MEIGKRAYDIQEGTVRLQELYDYPVDGLRDIFVNCNMNIDTACAMCDQFGIPRKQRKRGRIKAGDAFVPSLYDTPEIRQLHSMFPSMTYQELAERYWDHSNDLQKTVDSIIGSNPIYIPDSPDVELEYLKLKYAFIPADIVTATFMRCRNDYEKCVKTLEEENAPLLQSHAVELKAFMDRFGRSKHRWVVEYIRAKTPRTTATVEESDRPEPAPFRPLDSSKMKILNERQQAGEHLQNLTLLHNRRGEEARGYGKYLTGTVNAIQRERALYQTKNQETATMIFATRNHGCSIETLLERGEKIDFHGSQVKEVAEYMNRIFEYLRKRGGKRRVTIITGSGNHSHNFVSPVRNYVISQLESAHIAYSCEGGQVSFAYCVV